MDIGDLEKKVTEKEELVLKIMKASDLIVSHTPNVLKCWVCFDGFFEGCGELRRDNFYGHNISVSGVPIYPKGVVDRFIDSLLGVKPTYEMHRQYIISVRKGDVVGYLAFDAEYRDSSKNIVVNYFHEELLRDFIEIAENPMKYIKEDIAEKKRKQKEIDVWKKENKYLLEQKEKECKLLQKAERLQVNI